MADDANAEQQEQQEQPVSNEAQDVNYGQQNGPAETVIENFQQDSKNPQLPPLQLLATPGDAVTFSEQSTEAKRLERQPNSAGSRRESAAARKPIPDYIGDEFNSVKKEIDEQNNEINFLKDKMRMEQLKFPQSCDTRNEINNLKKQINNGLCKLNNLSKRLYEVRQKDLTRPWPVITFATTLEEDADDSSAFDIQYVRGRIEPLQIDSEECLSATPSSEHICDRPRIRRPGRSGQNRFSSERSSSSNRLQAERRRLQEELANRDMVVERLHAKVLKMQAELARLCKEKKNARFDECNQNEESNDSVINSGFGDDPNDGFDILDKNIQQATGGRDLDKDFDERLGEKQPANEIKKKYCTLLEEYARKDNQLQQIQAQLNIVARKQSKEKEDPIYDALNRQLNESREENEAQKIIICEQAQQIEDYSQRYMESLQKNEELKCVAKRLQMDNRKVEGQINMELSQIKGKFEAKLSEYAQYPKLLENEQMKLSQCSNQKQELERKLRLVCMEFRKIRAEEGAEKRNQSNVCPNCPQLQEQLNQIQAENENLRQCYNDMTKRYEAGKFDLDTLRNQSAKVICRLKDRAEDQRIKLLDNIHQLESNLAKARAALSITSSDKETAIKEMQGQLNCLSTSLDSSQKQIKTLKDHISYLNNGKTKSVVICCQADEKIKQNEY